MSKLSTRDAMKFIAVVNEKADLGQLFNTIGHMSAGLVWKDKENGSFLFHNYIDGSGGIHPSISNDPFIVLKAKNSNQIKLLRDKAELSKGVSFTDFTHSMTIGKSEEQLKVTSSKSSETLDYLGICFYGTEECLKPLTKKFSLFKPVDNSKELVSAEKLILKLQQESEEKDIELLKMKEQIDFLKSNEVSLVDEVLSIDAVNSTEEVPDSTVLIGEEINLVDQ